MKKDFFIIIIIIIILKTLITVLPSVHYCGYRISMVKLYYY